MPAEVDISGANDHNYPAQDDVVAIEDGAVDNMDTQADTTVVADDLVTSEVVPMESNG